ncbi:hypothetical protein GUJ93_ZPchr0013g36059 [Zizania palustris]|uniref:Tim10-like domain-containing protein n=1 Tax=Zizania palustris TaxID=103762 RepID=A0A8J5X2N2_ZIZPA|nr:hypothetical protein GUJ93_ZPchr0013g36059 [Zizania palustris]
MAATGQPINMQKEQMFGLAEKEMEYRVDLFNRLTQTCFDKCMEKKHKEAELNMGGWDRLELGICRRLYSKEVVGRGPGPRRRARVAMVATTHQKGRSGQGGLQSEAYSPLST